MQDQRQAKLGGLVANLAAMDELIADIEASKPREGALLPVNWSKTVDVIKGRTKDVENPRFFRGGI